MGISSSAGAAAIIIFEQQRRDSLYARNNRYNNRDEISDAEFEQELKEMSEDYNRMEKEYKERVDNMTPIGRWIHKLLFKIT